MYNYAMNSISHEAKIKDPNLPFECDPLKRGACADNLTNLIENNPTPLVMTVCAPWGQGKTTFIKRWQLQLKNQGFTTIHFNAWKYDYVDDPLISFIGAMKYATLPDGISKSAAKKVYSKVSAGISKVVRASPKIALNWALRGGFHYITDGDKSSADEIDAVSAIAADMMSQELNKQEGVRQQIEEFQETLTEYAESVTCDGKPLIIFIDELDRCRPDFSIELLERIKHLFSVPGVCFVLSVDRAIIAHAAMSRIGFPLSQANGYLRRFIDFDWHLPQPDSASFLKHCSDKIQLIRTKNRDPFDEFNEVYGRIADQLKLSLREQLQMMEQLKILISTYKDLTVGELSLLILYLIVASHDRDIVMSALNPPNEGLRVIRDHIKATAVGMVGIDAGAVHQLREIHDVMMPDYMFTGRSKDQRERNQYISADWFGVADSQGVLRLRNKLRDMLEFSMQFQEPLQSKSQNQSDV